MVGANELRCGMIGACLALTLLVFHRISEDSDVFRTSGRRCGDVLP